MRHYQLVFAAFAGWLFVSPPWLGAQHAVDPANRYYRVVCLLHYTGSGRRDDPIRPEYVPTSVDAKRQGILAWSVQLTDDGKMCIVHMAAANHHAFDAVLADTRPEVKVFEVGKTPAALITAAFGPLKAGFDVTKFPVVVR